MEPMDLGKTGIDDDGALECGDRLILASEVGQGAAHGAEAMSVARVALDRLPMDGKLVFQALQPFQGQGLPDPGLVQVELNGDCPAVVCCRLHRPSQCDQDFSKLHQGARVARLEFAHAPIAFDRLLAAP